MSITWKMLNAMRNAGDRFGGRRDFDSGYGYGGGGGYDSGYNDGIDDFLSSAGLLEDGLDSGALGDRVRQGIDRLQQARGQRLIGRGQAALARGGAAPSPVQQVAQEVEQQALAGAAVKQMDKKRYKLYRPIPIIAPASRLDAVVVAIAVTPTSRAFATHISFVGIFRLDALVINGQSLLPNGAVDTGMWQNGSQINMPLNIRLNTVPITGQATNNTGAALYMSGTLHTSMEEDADSERY